MSQNSTDSEEEFPELPPPVVTRPVVTEEDPVEDEDDSGVDLIKDVIFPHYLHNLDKEDKIFLYKTITIKSMKNILSENKLPKGKRKKVDLINKLFSLSEDQKTKENKRENLKKFIIKKLKGKGKEKKKTTTTKGSTSSPTETEDTPTETEDTPTETEDTPTKTTTTEASTSSARSNAKTTKNNNNNVYRNIDELTNSEAERKQALEILSKRKKTENQQNFLNILGRRLGGGGGGGGTPKPKRGQQGAPLVKLKVNKVNEPLPKMIFPSTTIVLAKKFSGKTNLLLNIVDKSQFDNIWIVSLTGFTGKLDSLCEDSDCLLEDVSDTMINELLKLHKEDRMNSLIVFDDVIGQVDMRSKGMQKLATMGRNFGISIIISAQDFFKVPPIWRRNSEYWYIGNLTDSNIEAVAKELSVPSFQKKRIRQELGEIARDKNHDWLYYDDRKTRFRKLFGTQFKIIV
jgi:hypothetical protein